MTRPRRPLLVMPLTALIALVAASLTWFDAPPMVRVPIGLVLGLYLPGYVLSRAVFPSSQALDGVERSALSFGLSLALITVLALMLGHSPGGLQHGFIAPALAGWTLLIATVAWWRQRRLLRTEPRPIAGGSGDWPRIGRGTVVMICALAAAVALAVTTLAVTVAAPHAPFTEFFLLGPDSLSRNYPRAVAPGEPMTLFVGVVSRELQAARFGIRVEGPAGVLETSGPVELSPGHTWEAPVTFALPTQGYDQEIKVLLFKDEATDSYRSLSLWVDVRPIATPIANNDIMVEPFRVQSHD